jgi:hypothetical protein
MVVLGLLALGSDSAVIGCAVGPLLPNRSARIGLAGSCGLLDGLATLIGASFGWQLSDEISSYLGRLFIICYALYLLGLTRWTGTGRRPAAVRLRRWPIALLPALLSLDNLAYGLGHAGRPLGSELLTGGLLAMVSSCLGYAGLATGRRLAAGRPAARPPVGRHPAASIDLARRSGIALLLAAAVLSLS